MRMSRCGKVKIFCCQSLKASMSGKTMIFLPLRELRRSDVSPDLPPVASRRYWGIIAEQMMAVFSDSTRAMILSWCWGRRCSPKRHWVSCQSLGRSFSHVSAWMSPKRSPVSAENSAARFRFSFEHGVCMSWFNSDTDRNCLGRSLRGIHSSLALRLSLRYPSLNAWSRSVLKQRK